MTRPRVSVVTPFFNTEEYLAECIESVLAQEWTDFEYILFDNLSTDGSYDIAQRYAKSDSRIRLLQIDTHVGQVPNYNAALRHCSPDSDYVKIVQADDWLFPRCLTEMLAVAMEHPHCRLILGHYHMSHARVPTLNCVGGTPLPWTTNPFSGKHLARRQLLDGAWYFGSPTTVMYRGEHVRSRHKFFREDRLHEDTDLCYEIAREHDIGFAHRIVAGVRIDNPSIRSEVSSFSPWFLDRLIQVESHGQFFLTPDELGPLRRETKRQYYRALAPRALGGAPPGFWDHHRKGLATIGLTVERGRLWAAVLRYLVEVAASPGVAIARVLARLKEEKPVGDPSRALHQ